MWSDNETADDLIGFQVHADLIREVVTDDKMLPLTIGVFGDWGGGKTSIMKMLERDLDADHWPDSDPKQLLYKGIAVVYFNGWLFEGYDDAKAAILSSILLALGDHKRFGPKIRGKALSLLKSVDWMRVSKAGLKHVVIPAAAALATGGVAAIPAAVALSTGLSHVGAAAKPEKTPDKAEGGSESEDSEAWFKAKKEEHAFNVRTFRERFDQLLKDSDIESLVVLIDDLDRCSPERVIENLEAIKLFLSVPSTAFVIGADPRIVEHAIRLRYAERSGSASPEESNRLVKDYLEKVIQVPYRLPRLSSSEIESYMALLFCGLYLGPEDAEKCVSRSKKEREANRYSAYGYAQVKESLGGRELSAPLTESLIFCSSAAPLIADGLEGNPRQVKRFLNAFTLRKKLAKVARLENIKDEVLVKLMILEYTNDELFLELFNLQARQAGFPVELAGLEKAVAEGTGYDEAAKALKGAWLGNGVKAWVSGTRQWLNPDAFVSVVDPTTGACYTGAPGVQNDSPPICQFGDSGRNSVRGPHFTYSDMFITKTFPIREGVKLRIDGQLFNAFNHPNFALPSTVQTGVPGAAIARFGTLQSTTSPPTGLLGVGLGGDTSPRMIAFQGRIEF